MYNYGPRHLSSTPTYSSESSRTSKNVIDELESQEDVADSLIRKLVEVEGMRSMQNFVTDNLF